MKLDNHRVLLINPFVYDVAAFDCWAKPKGLLEVGRLFRSLGFEIDFVDCLCKEDRAMMEYAVVRPQIISAKLKKYGTGEYFREEVDKPVSLRDLPRRYYRYGFPPDLFRQKLEELESPPILIGVTGIMTYWYRGVLETIRITKEYFPDTPFVLGGIYPSLLPDHAASFSGADYIFAGRATRQRLLGLLKELRIKMPGNSKHGGEFLYFPYPAPTYGVLNLTEGCYKKCTYCASRLLRPQVIEYDLKEVMGQIRLLVERGVRDFAFYDDFLLYEKEKRLLCLLRLVTNEFPEVRFHTPNGMHLNHIDAETARIMMKSNFTTLRFGFETVSPELIKRTGEKIGRKAFAEKIQILKDAGFAAKQIGIYVMIGLPGQTVTSVEESLAFVQECGVQTYITEFSPIAGTREYENALTDSLVDFSRDPELQNNSLLPLRNKTFCFEVVNRLKNLSYEKR